jgi:aspartokinase
MKSPQPHPKEDRMPVYRAPITLDGIKLSHELVLFNLRDLTWATVALGRFFGYLSDQRINLPFFTSHCSAGNVRISCCVARDDGNRIRRHVDGEPDFEGKVTWVPVVGMLSLFPHKSRLQMVETAFDAMAWADLTIYGFATSVSALTLVTDYQGMDRAVEALKRHFDLPRGFVPMKPEFQVRQSATRKPYP